MSSTGGSTAVCIVCGLFSVGMCTDCHRPVCGKHYETLEGRIRCPEDAARVRDQWRIAAATEAERQRIQAAEHDRGVLKRLLAVDDPRERLVRAVRGGTVVVDRSVGEGERNIKITLLPAASEACPELPPGPLIAGTRIRNEAGMIRWFIRLAQERRVAPNSYYCVETPMGVLRTKLHCENQPSWRVGGSKFSVDGGPIPIPYSLTPHVDLAVLWAMAELLGLVDQDDPPATGDTKRWVFRDTPSRPFGQPWIQVR